MDDGMYLLTEQGYGMTFNQSKDGNCSFQHLRILLVNMEYFVLPPHGGMKL